MWENTLNNRLFWQYFTEQLLNIGHGKLGKIMEKVMESHGIPVMEFQNPKRVRTLSNNWFTGYQNFEFDSSFKSVGCVGFLTMLYVILSHHFIDENNNKLMLIATKLLHRRLAFTSNTFWKPGYQLKDPKSWNNLSSSPTRRSTYVWYTLQPRAIFLEFYT